MAPSIAAALDVSTPSKPPTKKHKQRPEGEGEDARAMSDVSNASARSAAGMPTQQAMLEALGHEEQEEKKGDKAKASGGG